MSDMKDFIGLVCSDHLLGKLVHELCWDWPFDKSDNEIVVEVFNTILSYLFEVGQSRFDQIDNRKVRDAFTNCIYVLVRKDVAVTKCANFHDWSHYVLTIRVKHECFEL